MEGGVGRQSGVLDHRADLLRVLDLWVKVEKGVQAHFELSFDRFAASLEDVHGDMRLVAVFELDRSLAHFRDLVCRKKSHAVYQCQVCHSSILHLCAVWHSGPGRVGVTG